MRDEDFQPVAVKRVIKDMIRNFTRQDKQFYIDCSKTFYSSSAVDHQVDESNFAATFDLLMKDDPGVLGYILECDGERAGYFLASFVYSNEVGGTVMLMEELFILPEYRGQGLATSLFDYVKANFSDKVRRFRLEVTKSNVRAARLYERMGFKILNYSQMYIDN